jgi:hypothetical protein
VFLINKEPKKQPKLHSPLKQDPWQNKTTLFTPSHIVLLTFQFSYWWEKATFLDCNPFIWGLCNICITISEQRKVHINLAHTILCHDWKMMSQECKSGMESLWRGTWDKICTSCRLKYRIFQKETLLSRQTRYVWAFTISRAVCFHSWVMTCDY